MSSKGRGVKQNFIPQPQENSPVGKDQKGHVKLHQQGPTVQAGDSPVQSVDHSLPKGGNPTGRGQSQHNSVSGGKSMTGNNARSNPTSDKSHN